MTKTMLDELWHELLWQACSSDGPIRDADVRDAIRIYRPRIEHEAFEEGMQRQLERHLAEEQNPGRTVMVGPQEAVLDALERLADAASVEEEDWSPQTHDELVAALNEAGAVLRRLRPSKSGAA